MCVTILSYMNTEGITQLEICIVFVELTHSIYATWKVRSVEVSGILQVLAVTERVLTCHVSRLNTAAHTNSSSVLVLTWRGPTPQSCCRCQHCPVRLQKGYKTWIKRNAT